MIDDYHNIDLHEKLESMDELKDSELRTLASLLSSLLKSAGDPSHQKCHIRIRAYYSDANNLSVITHDLPSVLHVDFEEAGRPETINLAFRVIDAIREETNRRTNPDLPNQIEEILGKLNLVRERDDVIATDITEEIIQNLQFNNQ